MNPTQTDQITATEDGYSVNPPPFQIRDLAIQSSNQNGFIEGSIQDAINETSIRYTVGVGPNGAEIDLNLSQEPSIEVSVSVDSRGCLQSVGFYAQSRRARFKLQQLFGYLSAALSDIEDQ